VNWADRALLATLLGVIPKARRQGLRLLVTPDTILRWHRDIVRRRWAARSMRGRTGRPATRRSAFDPSRSALLLLGGDKADNWQRWYRDNIPLAEQLYLAYTEEKRTDRHGEARRAGLGNPGAGPSRRRRPR
jgi:hypothetical protein